MKTKIALLLSTLFFASQVSAQLQPNKAEMTKFQWQDLTLSQTQRAQTAQGSKLAGAEAVVGYKIPANQGTLNIKIKSPVVNNKTVFVPNVTVLDSNFNPSLNYPASQFKFSEERGLQPAQFQAELSLTPTANQDFIYLLVYTTTQDLQGKTVVTHPAKALAKAKGNQPPAIADIIVAHSTQGEVIVEVDGVQSSQLIGLNGPLFENKSSKPTASTVGTNAPQKAVAKTTQKVEQSTEDYFNQAVLKALKSNDVNKAMNLVNEAEQLGLKQPREIFLKHISVR